MALARREEASTFTNESGESAQRRTQFKRQVGLDGQEGEEKNSQKGSESGEKNSQQNLTCSFGENSVQSWQFLGPDAPCIVYKSAVLKKMK